MRRGEFRRSDPFTAAMAALGPALFAVIWKHSLYPYAGVVFDFTGYIELHVDNFLRGLQTGRAKDASHA
jgi:hypothetical protein